MPASRRSTAWSAPQIGPLQRLDQRARSRRPTRRSPRVHVSPEMTGADDLDRHGRWSSDPEYGALWTPEPGAARLGTVCIRALDLGLALGLDLGRRCAVGLRAVPLRPLGRRRRPLALGAGALCGTAGVCAGAGRLDRRHAAARRMPGGRGGGVSWIPLAPREAYVPPYRFSRGHVRDVNAPHFHHPREVERVIQTPHVERGAEYRNRKFHHGTTTIPLDDHERRHGPHRRTGAATRRATVRARAPTATAPGDGGRRHRRRSGSGVAMRRRVTRSERDRAARSGASRSAGAANGPRDGAGCRSGAATPAPREWWRRRAQRPPLRAARGRRLAAAGSASGTLPAVPQHAGACRADASRRAATAGACHAGAAADACARSPSMPPAGERTWPVDRR